jgi:Ca2+-binding EF-hand superfamily protein
MQRKSTLLSGAAVRALAVIVLSCVATLLAGCFNITPTPPVAAPPPAVAPPPPVTVAEVKPPEPVAPEVVPEKEPETPAEPPPPPIPTEKILLLSPQGPLIVEFELWIDGEPQARVFDQLLDEVMKLADTDGDGTPSWKEVTASPRFKYGQFGNLPIDRENAPKQILQQYDVNGNGYVERSELPRFLTRNAGGSRAFSVRSAELYHNKNRRGSPAWQAVDADDNGELSPVEMAAAGAQLRINDSDDDEILVVDELRPTSDVDPTEAMRSRGQFGDFTRLLGEHANWDSIRSALEQRYALGGTLNAEDFRLMGAVFAHVDENKDGTLSKKEFPRLNDVPAHLKLRIEFGSLVKNEPKNDESAFFAEAQVATEEQEEEKSAAPALIKFISSRLTLAQTGGKEPQVIDYKSRLVLRWPGVSLTFARNDTIATIDYVAQAEQGVKMYDANADGYLEASEVNEQVQAQFARFEALDSDADGKVYPGEVAAFLKQRQGAQRAQIHARGQDQEDALFMALDVNADERLEAQELDQAAARLKEFDANSDGNISPDELTEGIAVVFARGSVENANQLFVLAPIDARPPAANLPAWFLAMDTSRDGVISVREFLGSPEKFAALDKNQNGFFEPSEIPAQAETTASTAAPSLDSVPADDREKEQP